MWAVGRQAGARGSPHSREGGMKVWVWVGSFGTRVWETDNRGYVTEVLCL